MNTEYVPPPPRPARPTQRRSALQIGGFLVLATAIVVGTAGGIFAALHAGGGSAHASPAIVATLPQTGDSSGDPSTPPASSVPSCAQLVGQPTGSGIKSYTDTAITLGCITGPSVASDQTAAGHQACTTANGTKTVDFYWATKDPNAADQNVYAAVQGETILIVPKASAKTFWLPGGGLDSVAQATGCV